MRPVIGACALPLLLLAPQPWIEQTTPQRDTWELGAHGGAFILSERHDLYDLHTFPQRPLRRVGPLAGLRGAYFPLSFVGAEAEFDGTWTELSDGSEPVFAWGVRGSAILQLPLYRIVPFALGGYGLMGVRSSLDAVGNDVDPAGHYGLGIKLLVTPWLAIRVDGRHVLSAATARRRAVAHHGAVTLGLSFTLGRARASQSPAPPPSTEPAPILVLDSDQDGIADDRDSCPSEPGAMQDGCPAVDGDGDGILDLHDRCPALAGPELDGCPSQDADGDGILDRHDQCPSEFGSMADGCRRPDPEPVAPATPMQSPTSP